jgi:ATP-dependent Zn protease
MTKRTAYHEAGHAVIGVYRGIRIKEVKVIDREGEEDACVVWDHNLDKPQSEKEMESFVKTFLSGKESQLLYAPETMEYHHGGLDAARASRILKQSKRHDSAILYDKWGEEVAELLKSEPFKSLVRQVA